VDPHAHRRSATDQMRERIEGRIGQGLGARLEVARVVRVAATADLHDEIADVPANAVGEQVLDAGACGDPVAHDPERLGQHQNASA